MEAATCTLPQTRGLGPRAPDLQAGTHPAPGPRQPGPEPGGASGPQQPQQQQQQQQHSKPFFYVQPQQAFVPVQGLQWPLQMHMPMTFNPYFGYPGLGYGMPMMPHYQPNPYVEPPSFVVPHTHLHLVDYRRLLNPQYYQTMAYHSRRFRYQHNSQPREMTTSQVQTEPLVPHRTSGPRSSEVNAGGAPSSETLSAPSSPQKVDPPPEARGSVAPSTSPTPSSGSFTIQTEEVRIECCATPVGLHLLHAREAAEVSPGFSEDVLECGSVLRRRDLREDASSVPADQAAQALQVCPDILMGGTLGEKIPAALEDLRNRTEPFGHESQEGTSNKVVSPTSGKEQGLTSNDFNLKVVHLPFDAKYLDELRKMESSVWSTEETLIQSPESQVQNVSGGSHDETLVPSAEAETLMFREDVVTEEAADTPPVEEDEEENQISSLETVGDEVMADVSPSMGPSEDVAEERRTAETVGPNSPLTVERNQHRRDSSIRSDHQDTSFESLPAYLPSTSWFSDFDNVYLLSRVPQAPEKRHRAESSSGLDVPTRRRRLDMEHKDLPSVRKLKDRYKPKGKADHWSLSDQEYCLNRSFSENIRNTYISRREQLCSRCVEKHGVCASAGAGLDGQSLKRKAVPFQQRNDGVSPNSKPHPNKQQQQQPPKRGPALDALGSHRAFDTEGESSENSGRRAGPKWPDGESRRPPGLKRPLLSRQNVDRHPAPVTQKLREKNFLHGDAPRQPAAWERLCHCPHGAAVPEMDENCTAPAPLQNQRRNQVYVKQRWQTERSWKAVMSSEDVGGSKSDARSQLLIHRSSQPPSQGSRTKDTRC